VALFFFCSYDTPFLSPIVLFSRANKMCGNFGILFLPCASPGTCGNNGSGTSCLRGFEEILKDQCDRTKFRGSQAAGLSIISTTTPKVSSTTKEIASSGKGAKSSYVRFRVIPKKRENLSSTLLDKYQQATSSTFRKQLLQGAVSVLGHSRFATSSPYVAAWREDDSSEIRLMIDITTSHHRFNAHNVTDNCFFPIFVRRGMK